MQSVEGYRMVRLANGAYSLHSLGHHETFHPVIGPVAEASALYVRQLQLAERLEKHRGEFVIWDVGLGAAANAISVLKAAREMSFAPRSHAPHALSCPLRLVSFDCTSAALEFALSNAGLLGYFDGYEQTVRQLMSHHEVVFQETNRNVRWQFHLADFPSLLREHAQSASALLPLPKPHIIMWDAYSPAKNPAMWTQPLFATLFSLLNAQRPCSLATYSRSTLLRVSLLLAGFYVGSGQATGEKEETTIAANTPALIANPLDRRWLQRAHKSTSAEPLWEPRYRQAPLEPETWEALQAHPQFS